MSFKAIAFVSVGMLLGSVAPAVCAAEQAYLGQEQVHCFLCAESVEHNADTLWVPCGDHEFTVHTDCMRDYMHPGYTACPVCEQDFSDGTLEVLYAILAPVEVPMADVQEEFGEYDEELAQSIALSLQLENERLEAQLAEDQAFAEALHIAFNNESHDQEQPAQNEDVQNQQHYEEQELICTICQENLNNSGELRVLQCAHSFHVDCINPWLQESHTCPLCRGLVN